MLAWHRLLALAAASFVVTASGCELFGLGTIRCQGDEFCPSGYRCTERVCVPVSDVFGNPVDAGVSFDAAWVGPHVEIKCTAEPCCQTTPCSLMPDSRTPYCSNTGGQRTQCVTTAGTEYFGQDGYYDTGAPLYEIPGDGTVIDHVTGLIWEQAPTTDVGGGNVRWHEARDHCANLTLSGLSWRLPTYRELVTLVDYGMDTSGHPVLDDQAFPLTSSKFWSSSGHDDTYWWLEFGAGSNGYAEDSTTTSGFKAAARCVSGGAQVGGDFVFITGEGDWLDKRSGLAWSCEELTGLDWVNALAACENSTNNGHDDWRLPSVKELETIVDRAQASPIYSSLCLPLNAGAYWSSSPCAHTSGIWAVSIYGWTSCGYRWGTAVAKCVRSAR